MNVFVQMLGLVRVQFVVHSVTAISRIQRPSRQRSSSRCFHCTSANASARPSTAGWGQFNMSTPVMCLVLFTSWITEKKLCHFCLCDNLSSYNSRGSATAELKWGGSICFCLFCSSSLNAKVKKYWNQTSFAEVVVKIKVSYYFVYFCTEKEKIKDELIAIVITVLKFGQMQVLKN